jgi:hypothetical protein
VLRTGAAVVAATVVVTGASTAWAASTRTVSASGTVKYVKREASTKKIEQRGTVNGSPFGRGTLVLRSKLAARKTLEYSVTLTTSRGRVTGAGRATLKASGSQADYSGTLRITGGSGAYRGISKRTLKVTGRGDSTARSTTVRISGSVRY